MGTHSSDLHWQPIVVKAPVRDFPKQHPSRGLEPSQAWHAYSRALELQGLAVHLVTEHDRSVRHDTARRRMRLSVVLLTALAVASVLALVVVAAVYQRQLNA